MSTTATLAAFSDALSALGIDPHGVEVLMPVPDWMALDKQLAQEHADGLFEGVGVTGEITVKGVRYLVRFGTEKDVLAVHVARSNAGSLARA